jgi:hypothetical protein
MKISVSPCILDVIRWMFIRLTKTLKSQNRNTHFMSITFYSASFFSVLMAQMIYAVRKP